ncbi:MAG: ATP-binding protein, partial [Gammaproteobacteria bacterium]
SASHAGAPLWFARFVTPSATEVRHVIQVEGMPRTEIIVRPDAKDGIAEAWNEARSTLILLSLFFVVASVLMFITIGLGLRPINRIFSGLDGIKKGGHQRRLPPIKLPELSAIAEHFNHMAQALENSREQARYLARRSLEIQEAERHRLAHELHDEMGQSVSAIKAVAVAINRNSSDPAIKQQAQTIGEISTRVYDGVRRMTRRLRPATLDELGLVPALTHMVQDWNEASDPVCRLHISGEFDGLPEDVEIGLYRIVQECLTNVSKHAEASEVTVALDRGVQKNDRLCLRVADNGRGFDPASVVAGLGLRGVRQRVETLNGRFELQSGPGAGAKLCVELPILAGGI